MTCSGRCRCGRPGLVLELVVGRLMEGSRLRAARGLTVRELAGAAQLGDERDRERLWNWPGLPSGVRFSNAEVSEGDIAAAVESGRVLLERISIEGGGVRGGVQ